MIIFDCLTKKARFCEFSKVFFHWRSPLVKIWVHNAKIRDSPETPGGTEEPRYQAISQLWFLGNKTKPRTSIKLLIFEKLTKKVPVCQFSQVVTTGGPAEVRCHFIWLICVTSQACPGELTSKNTLGKSKWNASWLKLKFELWAQKVPSC